MLMRLFAFLVVGWEYSLYNYQFIINAKHKQYIEVGTAMRIPAYCKSCFS